LEKARDPGSNPGNRTNRLLEIGKSKPLGIGMKPRITVLTIGVDDLEKSMKFYHDGLGLPTEGIIGKEFEFGAVAFFDLQNGVKLALWPRKSVAHDTGLPIARGSAEFTIGHNVNSKKEVDEVMGQAEKAGAKIIKHAQDAFWGGYSGYFQDPDGHIWEVVWNPEWKIDE
jgi:catechol 2,3-dioxygenase-like lactoylglutathione lyase family enzyme